MLVARKTQQSKWTRYSDSTLDLVTSVLVSFYVNPIFLVLLLDFQQMKCCFFCHVRWLAEPESKQQMAEISIFG